MTIKISHIELEACRGDVSAWVAEKKHPESSSRPQYGYAQYVRDAILRMHKAGSTMQEARSHLVAGLAGNTKLKNETKKDNAVDEFDEYVQWLGGSDLTVAAGRFRLGYPPGEEVQLGGLVWRIDVLPSGRLRAIMLGDPPEDWRAELRFPLMQTAVAQHYGYPIQDVDVGWQALDGSNLDIECFGHESIVEAEIEFGDLRDRVLAEWG